MRREKGCSHLAVGQDGERWVVEEGGIPHSEQAHDDRQVLLEGHLAEVVVHRVGAPGRYVNEGVRNERVDV